MVDANAARARKVEVVDDSAEYARMTEEELDQRLALAKIDPGRTIESIRRMLQEKFATK